jgi:anti-anti-sigma regulatory factor
MLRVDIRDSANTLSIKLEGRFTGDDAERTRMLMTRCRNGARLVVDLTEVVFIDAVGEEILSCFGQLGAEFIAPTSYTLDVCERLQLRLARN